MYEGAFALAEIHEGVQRLRVGVREELVGRPNVELVSVSSEPDYVWPCNDFGKTEDNDFK